MKCPLKLTSRSLAPLGIKPATAAYSTGGCMPEGVHPLAVNIALFVQESPPQKAIDFNPLAVDSRCFWLLRWFLQDSYRNHRKKNVTNNKRVNQSFATMSVRCTHSMHSLDSWEFELLAGTHHPQSHPQTEALIQGQLHDCHMRQFLKFMLRTNGDSQAESINMLRSFQHAEVILKH